MSDVPVIEANNEPTSTGFIPAVMAEMRQEFDAWLEDGAYNAVCEVGFKVNKEELMKLLRGDRQSYEKGYEDGKRDAMKHGHWVRLCDGKTVLVHRNGLIHEGGGVICSECGEYLGGSDEYAVNGRYCPNCGAKMD